MQHNKRPRLEDGPPNGASEPQALSNLLEILDARIIKQLLLNAAVSNPSVAESVIDAVEAKRRAESARTIDFDHFSRSAWYSINKEHSRKSGVAQFEVGHEVAQDIEEMFKTMSDTTPEHASYGTKRSAVETMRKIMKSVALSSGSELAKVVRNSVTGLDDTLVEVLGRFTADELERLSLDFKGEWRDKLEELDGFDQFDNIQEAIDILDGADLEDEESEDEYGG